MVASINMYIKSTFHVIMYQNEMKFHMLVFMNVWMMLVLKKCKCKMQCLTLGSYIKLRKLSITLLLTPKADSTTDRVKIHREAEPIQLRVES